MDLNIIIAFLCGIALLSILRVNGRLGRLGRSVRSLTEDNLHLTRKLDQAGQSLEAFRKMREQCRQELETRLSALLGVFRENDPKEVSQVLPTVAYCLGRIEVLWCLVDSNHRAMRWAYEFAQKILLVGTVSKSHLGTWRTEAAAALVYLFQLDGQGHMGIGGVTRFIADEELHDLAVLVPGMRWIIDRTRTRNCPFSFGPYIERDLEALIARIETLKAKA
jgi:hypothetical protein